MVWVASARGEGDAMAWVASARVEGDAMAWLASPQRRRGTHRRG